MSQWIETVYMAKDGCVIRQREAEKRFPDRLPLEIVEPVLTGLPVPIGGPAAEEDPTTQRFENRVYKARKIAFHTREEVGDRHETIPISDRAMAEIVNFLAAVD